MGEAEIIKACLQSIYSFPTDGAPDDQSEGHIRVLCQLLHSFAIHDREEEDEGLFTFQWAANILAGKTEVDGGFIRIRWFPKYGCAMILASSTVGCLDEPQAVHIDLVALDRWSFGVHMGTAGENSPPVPAYRLL